MGKANGFVEAIDLAKKWIMTEGANILTLDIENTYNKTPFEAILNGLIRRNVDGTLISYIMHML